MRKLIATAVTAVALSGAAAFAQMNHSAHGDMSPASQSYVDAMTKMDGAMKGMSMTGKPGADFALMMIPHHQSAIDMAKAYLASGDNDPELTKLSNEVVAAQEKEISFLQDWLKRNGH